MENHDNQSIASGVDLDFDGLSAMGEEIPNTEDLTLVHHYAEREKGLLKKQEDSQAYVPPPQIEVVDVPGDDDGSESSEEEDAVKSWVKTAAENVVSRNGNNDKDDDDDCISEDEADMEVEGKGQNRNSNAPIAVSAPSKGKGALNVSAPTERKSKEPEKAPQIDIIYPEVIGALDAIEEVGRVHAIIEGTLVIAGTEGSRALDLQSLLCLEDRSALGVICDTFGPVNRPHYLVYLTSPKALIEMSGELEGLVGKKVYAVMEESTFAIDENDLSKALAGLQFMQPIEDDASCSTDDDIDAQLEHNIPNADVEWLRRNGCPPEFLN